MSSPLEQVVAVLELVASEHPMLFDFQLGLILNSSMRPAIVDLAVLFEVEQHRVGVTVYQACLDLARLERTPRWRHPADVVDSPNLAALYHVCLARTARVQGQVRRRKLGRISRRLEEAHRDARTRAWIGAFLGSRGARGAGDRWASKRRK